MFVQLLVVVHIWETINEDNKGGVNDVYFACLLNDPATIKDVVSKFFGRFNDRKRLRDAGTVEWEAAVVVHELKRSRHAGFLQKCRFPPRVPFDKKTIPFLLERNAECLFIYLALKADAGLLIVPIDGAYFIVAILPEPERVEETETKPFGMGTHDVYTEVREVAVHKGDVRVIAFNAENADSLVLFAILAHEAVADKFVAHAVVKIKQDAGLYFLRLVHGFVLYYSKGLYGNKKSPHLSCLIDR